jgi:hypothetical protein
MAQGPSGRIVLEIDPSLKRDLYSRLASEGFSLKQWFIKEATEYIAERDQPSLPGITSLGRQSESMLAAEEPSGYGTTKARQE